MSVAVIAHAGKTLGGGLPELRRVLRAEGLSDPLWYEAPKAKKAPPLAERALREGADLIFVWGGDGMVRRCVDVIAGSNAAVSIIPAGTANLFAANMGIPKDIAGAVAVGLRGERRQVDVGRLGKERFAVMAGVGFDAAMIRDADGLKEKVGRAAYVVSGSRNLHSDVFKAEIEVDGSEWYEGKASCILVGNLGDIFGGVHVFPDARPDDGVLELGVVNADGPVQWARTLARTALGKAHTSPFVRATKARSVRVELDRKVLYELDGGDRRKVRSFTVEIEPLALTMCVPAGARAKEER